MWQINRKAGYQLSWQIFHSQGKQDTCQNIEFKFVFIVFWKHHLVYLRQLFQRPFVSSFCPWIAQWYLLVLNSLPHILPACLSDPILSCHRPSMASQQCMRVAKTSIWLIGAYMCSKETKSMFFFPFKNYTVSFISFILSLILWKST